MMKNSRNTYKESDRATDSTQCVVRLKYKIYQYTSNKVES